MQTLKHVMLTQEYVKSKGLEPRYHYRSKSDPIHYCTQCEVSAATATESCVDPRGGL